MKYLTKIPNPFSYLKELKGDPKKIALGFALGVFIGMTPFIGFQIFIAVFFASLLKWDKVAAGIGVFNTNPLTAPFLFGSAYVVGAYMLQLETTFSIASLSSLEGLFGLFAEGKMILLAITLGGVVVGIPLALIAYYTTFFAISRWNRMNEAVELETRLLALPEAKPCPQAIPA